MQETAWYYNRESKPLAPLKSNDVVRFKHGNHWKPAVVLRSHTTPCSYIIKTADGTELRRNRHHLRKTNENITVMDNSYFDDEDDDCNSNSTSLTSDNDEVASDGLNSTSPPPITTETRTRSGRIIRPPARYCEQVV